MRTIPSRKIYDKRRRIPRTYLLEESTARAITEVCAVLQVLDSDLVGRLIDYGLDGLASGELEIETEPVLRRIVRS